MPTPPHPAPLLQVLVEAEDLEPALTAWCAGFEAGEWRADQLAKHLLRWLPEFALRYDEWSQVGSHNMVDLLAKAAASIYASTNYEKRGEFGEVLLHAMIRQRFKSAPAVAKYFYKDAVNDTVKGFDAVHIVPTGDSWELWLGEVKFYKDITRAIRDVVEELSEHTERDYLRSEFTAITNKLDDSDPRSDEVRELLHKNTSVDDIFSRVCIPVLLTYDSEAVANHTRTSADYKAEFEAEVRRHRDTFASKDLPQNVTIRLMLLPLESKKKLVQLMDAALKQCQQIL